MSIKTFTALLFTLSAAVANAALQDLGNITRDTDTGLDWLDVTETRGLSYNQVMAQMGPGGTYEGWRYATTAELDQLIINFGYTAINSCAGTHLHCDPAIPGDSLVIESFIKTMGDTWDAYADILSGPYDTTSDGAGWTQGLIDGNNSSGASGTDYAMIADSEHVIRGNGAFGGDADDIVNTAYGSLTFDQTSGYIGSFLVKSTAPEIAFNIPIPSLWLVFLLLIMARIARSTSRG